MTLGGLMALFSATVVFAEPLESIWSRIGKLLAFFGALTMILGIGDVVYTFTSVTVCQGPSFSATVCLMTIISAGVWGAAAVCITGTPR